MSAQETHIAINVSGTCYVFRPNENHTRTTKTKTACTNSELKFSTKKKMRTYTNTTNLYIEVKRNTRLSVCIERSLLASPYSSSRLLHIRICGQPESFICVRSLFITMTMDLFVILTIQNIVIIAKFQRKTPFCLNENKTTTYTCSFVQVFYLFLFLSISCSFFAHSGLSIWFRWIIRCAHTHSKFSSKINTKWTNHLVLSFMKTKRVAYYVGSLVIFETKWNAQKRTTQADEPRGHCHPPFYD